MESNQPAPKRPPLTQQLEVLAQLGELPDLLTRDEIMLLWHGRKRHRWDNHAAKADAVLLDRAIQSGTLACKIEPERTEPMNPPAGGAWFTGYRTGSSIFDDGDDLAELQRRTAPRPQKIPAVYWIHRNAMRAWLAKPSAPRIADDSLLRRWWPDLAAWDGTGRPKKPTAADVLPELDAWRADHPGSTWGDGERAIAVKYDMKPKSIQKARERRDQEQRPLQAAALRAAGAAAQKTRH
jgi:hypothetical protein